MVSINDAKANIYRRNNEGAAYRYIAKSEFTVRTSDIKKLKKALVESLDLISKDIVLGSKNTWQPVEYIFMGLNDLKPSMIEEATTNARKVAENLPGIPNQKLVVSLMHVRDYLQSTIELKIPLRSRLYAWCLPSIFNLNKVFFRCREMYTSINVLYNCTLCVGAAQIGVVCVVPDSLCCRLTGGGT